MRGAIYVHMPNYLALRLTEYLRSKFYQVPTVQDTILIIEEYPRGLALCDLALPRIYVLARGWLGKIRKTFQCVVTPVESLVFIPLLRSKVLCMTTARAFPMRSFHTSRTSISP